MPNLSRRPWRALLAVLALALATSTLSGLPAVRASDPAASAAAGDFVQRVVDLTNRQ